MEPMSLNHTPIPEITGGVLLSATGEVHRQARPRATGCDQTIPDRHARVSHVQAVVHKLPLCSVCFPSHTHHPGKHHQRGGR
jgi:hypothetical protein